jgi:hypothetical protein
MHRLLLSILLILPFSLYSQDEVKGKNIFGWASIGISNTYSKNSSSLPGLRLAADLSIYNKLFCEFGYSMHSETDFTFSDPDPFRVIGLRNYSLLLGSGKYILPYLAIMGYTGLSWGSGEYRGDFYTVRDSSTSFFNFGSPEHRIYEHHLFHYTGIPVHVKVLWTGSYVGFSMDLYYNFHHYADYGIIFSGNFGKIRNPKKL